MTRGRAPIDIRVEDVSVVTGGHVLLDGIDWSVATGEHTVVLGPNGAGKTTLLRVVAGHRFATTGTVDVLGHRLGRVDMRTLRRRIGIVSDALTPLLRRDAPVRNLVAAAIRGVTFPSPRDLDEDSLARADEALATVALADLAHRPGTTLSGGEWQRALLARALVVEPRLLLLDEPCAGLDLAQREHFLSHLDDVLADPSAPTTVVVTHHLEEVPRGVTHALLLRDGQVHAAGPLEDALTDETVSSTFDLPVTVARADGRLQARADR